MQKIKILYLYSGKRKEQGKIGIDYPDTKFYGLNHLKEHGLEAEYKEFKDLRGIGFLDNLLGFRLRHLLMFFLAKDYDLVFGSSLIYMMPLQKLFRTKTKFVFLNIYLNRLLSSHKNNFLKFYITKFLIGSLDGIVCLSNSQRERLIKRYHLPEEKVVFIPLGTDINFHRYISDEKRDDFILSAGSDDGRDYRTVLKVAKLCPNLKFVIVCGFKNVKNIDKNEISDNIEILYYISSIKLRSLYQRARALLLATYPDNCIQGADCSGQTVLLDAMASGLPVIATKKAYLSDYARDGQEIIISNSNSPQELKKEIELLLSSQKLREKLSRAARNKVENSFSSRLMAERLSSYFRKVLK